MTEQPTDVAPADFDLDAWINGTKPTERSCVITARGDLVAQADDLLRRYEAVKDVDPAERGVNDDSPDAILAQLEQLDEQLAASRTTWHLRALTPKEIKAAGEAAEAAVIGDAKDYEAHIKDGGEPADYTAHQVAAAVTRVVQPDGSVATSVTPEQVQRLRERLGESVTIRLVYTLNLAMSEEPSITAPFSRKSSPDPGGQESSPSSEPPETGESPTA